MLIGKENSENNTNKNSIINIIRKRLEYKA